MKGAGLGPGSTSVAWNPGERKFPGPKSLRVTVGSHRTRQTGNRGRLPPDARREKGPSSKKGKSSSRGGREPFGVFVRDSELQEKKFPSFPRPSTETGSMDIRGSTKTESLWKSPTLPLLRKKGLLQSYPKGLLVPRVV